MCLLATPWLKEPSWAPLVLLPPLFGTRESACALAVAVYPMESLGMDEWWLCRTERGRGSPWTEQAGSWGVCTLGNQWHRKTRIGKLPGYHLGSPTDFCGPWGFFPFFFLILNPVSLMETESMVKALGFLWETKSYSPFSKLFLWS